MTEDQARRVANVVMAAAALGAAVIVLRSPSLRRLVWGFVKRSGGPLAVYAATVVHEAWSASAHPAPTGYGVTGTGSLEYDRVRAPNGAPRLR